MSNNFTAVCNLTRDAETLTLGERELVKMRLANNTFGKGAEALFFDALVGGPDYDAAIQLKQGDKIAITGTLVKSSYKGKKGKMKGKVVETFSMPFAKLMTIIKSESFFAGSGQDDEAEEGSTEAPDLGDAVVDADTLTDDDPLAGVV